MNSTVTYLSSRSLAAYETMLIESYGQQYQREVRLQSLKVFLIGLGFISLAFLALMLPVLVSDLLRRAWF